MDRSILGKWSQIENQPYPGLYFEFLENGTFEARYDALGIVSSGTWQTNGNQIDMDQQKHTFGLVGNFEGIYQIEDDMLKLSLVAAGDHERPANLDAAVLYRKEEA
ncbi:MAG: hypothetical protein PHW11_01365 [Anaerolineaceae bacterium]|jgi:hypothetical protein|nr:hypothetical protein [Anaerolineaceae bacterium]MDD4043136.1 hypothetical protein [Anaerolineaceae bacterium]MDD4577872.1 hypothetical protein [Anaerolineaceae bacterium]